MYSDNEFIRVNLDDKRFDPNDQMDQDTKILWLYDDYDQKRFLQWDFNERYTYVSWFKKDEALTSKNNLAHLINTTLGFRGAASDSD